MALESASYINGLVPSNPAAGDPVTQADDHLRLIKAALLATFPNLTGPVTATQGDLNVAIASLTGTQTLTNKTLTSPVVTTPTITNGTANGMTIGVSTAAAGRFTTLEATGAVSFLPRGFIGEWYGSVGTIPSGWLLCDGTNDTPDLRGRFVMGAGGTYAVGATGGSADAVVVSHNHTATVTDPGHLHDSGGTQGVQGGYVGNSAISTGGSGNSTTSATTGITVTNTAAGVSGTNANLPPYYALCYIMRA